MITTIVPENWKELQNEVAEILRECGFLAMVEKKVETTRGTVELDVYAEEEVKGRKYSIVCECKFWKSDIPQTVVQGFRTVINDLGSNIGYIITTSDFQKGAIQTAKFTNIELLTWEEFQNKFFESWFEEYFAVTITNELDPLLSYAEPLVPKWFSHMSPEDQALYYCLKEKYDPIGSIVLTLFSTYSRTLTKDIPKLPLVRLLQDPAQVENKIPADILNEIGYKEFLVKTIEFGKAAIAKFRGLRDKYKAVED